MNLDLKDQFERWEAIYYAIWNRDYLSMQELEDRGVSAQEIFDMERVGLVRYNVETGNFCNATSSDHHIRHLEHRIAYLYLKQGL